MDALRSALDAALGSTYTIEKELDGGGMSRVFLATEHALGRRVAIKVLPDAGRALDAQRFRQEILYAAGLQHPHIVPVHTAGDINGLPYFVMPFVDGVSLRTRIRDAGAMPIGEATRVLRDVASALQCAHERGIVHRDLKPENVVLSGGSAVVLDFGVAKAVAAGSGTRSDSLTGAGYSVGTPRYMAPEQAASDPALDHRADIYAFGVLAFELFTGEPPFSGTPSEILRKHIAEEPPDLAPLRPSLPPALLALVRACLEKSPDHRPQSAAAVMDALDGVATPLSGTRVPVARKTTPRRGPGWAQVVVIPAVYLVAAGGLLAYLFHLAAQERVREGIVAAGVIGSLIGLPLAVAGGMLVRVMGAERLR